MQKSTITEHQTTAVKYAIQATERDDGRCNYQLLIEHRAIRGLIRNIKTRSVGRPCGETAPGFVLDFIADDGQHERIGTESSPLPVELLKAMKEGDGLVIAYVDGGDIVGGQTLAIQ